jgi:hypothetical protein
MPRSRRPRTSGTGATSRLCASICTARNSSIPTVSWERSPRRRIPSDCLLADGRRLEAARRGVLHERIGKSGYTAEARAQRNTRRLVCPGEAFQGDLGYRPGYHSRHRLSGRPAQPGSRDTRSLLNWAVSGERLLPCSGVAAGAVPIWSGRVCDSATSAERWPPAADPLRK